MTTIIVTEFDRTQTDTGEYFAYKLSDGKRNVSIVFSPSHFHNPVHVIVMNAAHKAYRGMGRSFPTVDAAVEGYKTESVKAMIRHAAELREELIETQIILLRSLQSLLNP